jgi:hypothetical protein
MIVQDRESVVSGYWREVIWHKHLTIWIMREVDLYKAHLTELVHIRRRVMGYKGRMPWSSVEQMRVELHDIIDDWETTLSAGIPEFE